ncbi:zinc finger CCCH domain-containing protein 23-like [Senna tora]|uniref:Zinc finger CCCH domain-containing protein 23-like n=1 Tax=Senna tora TaxID=362788 RepID=A0A834WRZ5_9FABA|nr:zinc finger CCCH domain-containing protein 23-like [Senna tora]
MMIGEPTRLVPNLQISHPHTSPTPFPTHLNFNANPDFPPSIDFDLLCHHDDDLDDVVLPFDAFSADHFRMFEFKIRKCARARSHDWTQCPYAHPGEKARRRDPRKHHYSGAACPEFRKGNCRKGDSCEFAHGVFECWLHPSRYRTQFCKDGINCRRPVCFFAHSPDQLRFLVNNSADSSSDAPISCLASTFVSSPTSVLNSSLSPPTSPGSSRYGGVCEIATSLRNVQLDENYKPPSSTRGLASPRAFGFGSPRGSNLRPGFPNRSQHEEPAMERVESGRELRAKIYAKLTIFSLHVVAILLVFVKSFSGGKKWVFVFNLGFLYWF